MLELRTALSTELQKRGLMWKTASIKHVRELKEEITDLREKSLLDEQFFNENLHWIDFNYKAAMPDAETILVIASLQLMTLLNFQYGEKNYSVPIPPTYVYSKVWGTVEKMLLQILSPYHYSIKKTALPAKDIMNCRTEALGGHIYECEECGYRTIQYNSCRNRHCPLCQGVAKAVWIDQRSRDILNAPYFHVVFTMPVPLQPLIYQNQELLYNLMYRAAAETLSQLAQDEKHLGAQIGFFSLLHTWGQDLHYHPHIHTVVLAGGLTKLNQWRNTSKKFFIPVKKLSKKFRGKFLYYLKQYYRQNLLEFYADAEKYREPKNFRNLVVQCYAESWYSYTQRTFSGPLAVIKYLGRYTNRIAISNTRIVSMDERTVTINIKDYKDGNKTKTLTLEGSEFIRRFLMHILPKGFVKVRHYGLLANRNKKTKLELCRRLTLSPTYKPQFEGLTTLEILCLLARRDILLCPACREKRLQIVYSFAKGASP